MVKKPYDLPKGGIKDEIEQSTMPTTGVDKSESVQSVKTDWALSFYVFDKKQ